MKTLANRIGMLAASAMVLGTMAYGQTQMKAQIPFAFRTAAGSLPAGEYNVRTGLTTNGGALAILQDQASRHNLLLPGGIKDAWKAGTASLLFRCNGNDGCVLTGIRTSTGQTSYYVGRKHTGDKEVAVVAVPVRIASGD